MKLIIYLAAAFTFVLIFPTSTKAHVLQADSEIGAILHITPDDNPVSGRPVDYLLSFEDTSNRFSLFNCTCSVDYVLDGEVIASRPLTSNDEKNSLNSFTFPGPGNYELQITGTPLPGSEFQAFEMKFSVRVSSGEIIAQDIPNTLLTGIGGAIGLVVLAAYVMESSNKAKTNLR